MDERLMEVIPGLEGIPAAESAISYIDGEAGILEYRGIPIEELAEKSNYLETAYLLIFGKLPSIPEFEKFSSDVTHHTRLKLKILRMKGPRPGGRYRRGRHREVKPAMGMYYP